MSDGTYELEGGPDERPDAPAGGVGRSTALRGDPFERSVFHISQKILAVNQHYNIEGPDGSVVCYGFRSRRIFRSMLCAAAMLLCIIVGLIAGGAIGSAIGDAAGNEEVGLVIGLVSGGLLGGVVGLVLSTIIYGRRHVDFTTQPKGGELLFRVEQDNLFQILLAWYTVREGDEVVARLRKHNLWDLLRKQWRVYGPDGEEIAVAREDSWGVSLARRFIPYASLIFMRTNFEIIEHETKTELGAFKRKWSVKDKYLLDVGADELGLIDRRVAVALAVMLDTGERR